MILRLFFFFFNDDMIRYKYKFNINFVVFKVFFFLNKSFFIYIVKLFFIFIIHIKILIINIFIIIF